MKRHITVSLTEIASLVAKREGFQGSSIESVSVSGDYVFFDLKVCTLNYHRELWGKGIDICDVCQLHIKGPARRKR
jgi:hypothetical protein